MVAFRIINRQGIDAKKFVPGVGALPPPLRGKLKAPAPEENTWVWHCHILSHEEHEMMRRFRVA